MKPAVKRMLDDPKLFDPVQYVELQDLDMRREMQLLADDLNPMKAPGWPEGTIKELTSHPSPKYDRLLQIEIENIQSVGGERELSEQDMERAEKNVRLQMFNTNADVNKLSNYIREELRKRLR